MTATGPRTKFGRTAELVRTAHVVSSQQKAVLRVVRNLAVFNGIVILMLIAYAYFLKMPYAEIVPLVLTAILASIPVALPATFTLAASLGAKEEVLGNARVNRGAERPTTPQIETDVTVCPRPLASFNHAIPPNSFAADPSTGAQSDRIHLGII